MDLCMDPYMDLCLDPCMDLCLDPCMDPCIDPSMDPSIDPNFLFFFFREYFFQKIKESKKRRVNQRPIYNGAGVRGRQPLGKRAASGKRNPNCLIEVPEKTHISTLSIL